MDENEIDFLLKELDNENLQWDEIVQDNNNISTNSINIDDNLPNEIDPNINQLDNKETETVQAFSMNTINCNNIDDNLPNEIDPNNINLLYTKETENLYNCSSNIIPSTTDVMDQHNDFLHSESDNNGSIDILNGDINEKRIRNKKKNLSKWKRNSNQILRMKGQSYLGYTRSKEKVISHNTNRQAKTMLPTCTKISCQRSIKRKCNEILEDDRLRVFTDFWSNLSWSEKKIYVTSLVKKTSVKQRKVDSTVSRRNSSFSYFLKVNGELLNVCKTMFLNTLALGESQVHNWCITREQCELSPNTPKVRCLRDSPHKKNRKFVNKFLEQIPKMPSHYCRTSTSKLYLEPYIQSKSQLYNMYIEMCNNEGKENNIVSINTFYDIVEKNNISLFSPKKDQCDTCCSYQTNNISEKEWKDHIEDKNQSREEKCLDKEKALLNEILVFTMDLQAVKVCPYLKASALYYKSKLCVHNFTTYNLATHESTCYWWDETQSDLSASSFVSCIIDQLTECHNKNPNLNIILWSDGCCYQNRNNVLSNALLEFAINNKVVIEQKYLTKGHTQMECDSVHSNIERKLKNADIYLPSDYLKITQSARKKPFPYNVKWCDTSFFKQYQIDLNRYDSLRPGKSAGDPTVTNIKSLRYNSNGTIDFKTNFDDEYSDLRLAQKKRKKMCKITSPIIYGQLHAEELKIPKSKWEHLQQLKKVIPNDCHEFYNHIKYYD